MGWRCRQRSRSVTPTISVACPDCGGSFRPKLAWPVRDVALVIAGPANEERGLLAWAAISIGPLRLDGLAVRRRLDGELIVTYPARKDPGGKLHRSMTPLDPELDRQIRTSIIAAYLNETRRTGQEDRE
jgi:hypothetical protein